MTNHTITPPSAAILGDVHTCVCGARLDSRMAAELHAAETGQCTVCLGSAEEQVAPGLDRGCTACAATGRRREQIIWQLAHAEAEQVITPATVRGVVAEFDGPFHLSQIADAVRDGLGLPPGRLPVGPRVRDLLLDMQAAGEIAMLSAPDELLDGADVVLYRDPQWQRAGTLDPGL
ncbi:hypothetical protein [Nonomuraea indica]|uniref:Uncharacterized protein n=1 Tax=Nonomuraea indica TaxID=1581193 RepID=A0ABW8AE21_9ACTN|nr:hypothetical protein [Nonomuraea indica]